MNEQLFCVRSVKRSINATERDFPILQLTVGATRSTELGGVMDIGRFWYALASCCKADAISQITEECRHQRSLFGGLSWLSQMA